MTDIQRIRRGAARMIIIFLEVNVIDNNNNSEPITGGHMTD